jgi:hypothetical protein
MAEATFSALERHLQERAEQVAFMLANVDGETFAVTELRLLTSTDYAHQSDWHVHLMDQARPDLLQWATGADAALVEAHSHGLEGCPSFSGSDQAGFSEWVPHVRWRLQGRPYAALVQAGAAWDGLAWFNGGPEPVTAIEFVDSDRVVEMTGATLPRWQHHGSRVGRVLDPSVDQTGAEDGG